MDPLYKDPILKKYSDLITASTSIFKAIYFGDPIRIPNSSLPALVISKIDTKVGNLSNVEDVHSVRISLTVVSDIRDTISDDKTMVPGVNSLYNIMEGRAVDYTLKKDSLLYILRHNVEIDPGNNLRTDLSTMSRIDYGLTMGKRKAEAWSIEGMLEITANFMQNR